MSTLTRPAGPLPPRVYWTRRLLLVALVLAVVYGVARLTGLGGADQGTPSARQAGAAASSSSAATPTSAPTTAPTAAPTTSPTAAATSSAPTPSASPTTKASPSKTPLAVPTGACPDGDVVATPSVRSPARAGSSVVLVMSLTTQESAACDWTLSPRTFAVKVSDGEDRIWSSQECEDAVASQRVTVRRDHPARIAIAWNGQRSDPGCTGTTSWVDPGTYQVTAAAFGSDPVTRGFALVGPQTPTVTTTPKPERDSKSGRGPSDRD